MNMIDFKMKSQFEKRIKNSTKEKIKTFLSLTKKRENIEINILAKYATIGEYHNGIRITETFGTRINFLMMKV